MAIIDNTATAAVKQAAIAEIVQRELAFQAKLLPTISDFSAFAKPGDYLCRFPKSNSFTVQNKASGTAGTDQVVTYAFDEIPYDFRAHVQWVIEDMDAFQAKPDVKKHTIGLATTAHAREIDKQIIAKLDAANGHAVAGVLTAAKITEGLQFLEQNYSVEDKYLVLPALGHKQLLDINDFVRADSYGNSNLPSGVVGKLYGVNVIIHAGLTKGFMYSKEAVGIAFQMGAKYAEQPKNEYGVGSYLAAMTQLYGTKAMRLGEGKALDNTTALGGSVSPFIVEYALA